MSLLESTHQQDLKYIQELKSFIERAISLTASNFREQLLTLERTSIGSELVTQYRQVSSQYFGIVRESSSSSLDSQSQIDLKKSYNQIARKTHPDATLTLDEGLRKEREEVFKEATSAFDNQDFKKLQLLLLLVSDGPNELGQTGIELEKTIAEIREKADQVFLEAIYIGRMNIGEFYNFIEASIKHMQDFIAANKQSCLKDASILLLPN